MRTTITDILNRVITDTYFYKYQYRSNGDLIDIGSLYSSIDNWFVPLFAGISGKVVKSGIHKALIYNCTVSADSHSSIPGTARGFITNFHRANPLNYYYNNEVYHLLKHFVFTFNNNKVNPLYCLCVTRQDIFKMNSNAPFDFSKAYLILHTDLLTPNHKYLYSKLKPIIKYLTDKGVHLITSSNPDLLIFNTQPAGQSFKTIKDRLDFMETIKGQLGLYERPKPESKSVATTRSLSDSEVEELQREFPINAPY